MDMRAEILSIGTELLLGQITDTNAVFLAQRLAEIGVPLYYRDTVGDNFERLEATLRLAKSRATVILCTGGLGPTEDDITSQAIANVFDAPLEMHAEGLATLEEFFRQRGRELTANQSKQAMLPQGAQLVPNPVGTAPGFMLTKDGCTVVAFPGPPHEMHPMWRETVGPYLQQRSGAVIFSRTLRFCGIGEGALEMELKDLIAQQGDVTIAPYAKLGEVHLRLTARTATEEEAMALIAPVEAAIRERLGRYLYGIDEETLEEVVGKLLRDAEMTLAVAESCTGGLLGGRITGVPGSSDFFQGGIISYSNTVKQRLLHVAPATLAAHGAVSAATAREMAEGVVKATGAAIGISITGVAGPGGGSDEKPVGLVYLAVAVGDNPARAFPYNFGGDRATIRHRAVQEALVLLRDVLNGTEITYW
ncbi:MAG TPA: competence/damage-inducible protein A [Armatimonadota bacterium]|jgi:nicotinamide-nucleotide amidase